MGINEHRVLVHQEDSSKKEETVGRNCAAEAVIHFERNEEDVVLMELGKEEEEGAKNNIEKKSRVCFKRAYKPI